MPPTAEAAFAALQQLEPREAVEALKKRGAAIRREIRNEALEEIAKIFDTRAKLYRRGTAPREQAERDADLIRSKKVEVPHD